MSYYNMKGPGDFDPPDDDDDRYERWEEELTAVQRGLYALRFIEEGMREFSGLKVREFDTLLGTYVVVKRDLNTMFECWLYEVFLKEVVL